MWGRFAALQQANKERAGRIKWDNFLDHLGLSLSHVPLVGNTNTNNNKNIKTTTTNNDPIVFISDNGWMYIIGGWVERKQGGDLFEDGFGIHFMQLCKR